MNSRREVWIDYIKVFACVLVALGHFFQSMTAADILPETVLYKWFEMTIYYFHVPLFFICSGYLYQKYSRVDSIGARKNSVIKKAISLGIPYFVFSFATWLLKMLFSGVVNGQIGGLGDTLFLHPTSPYWYLYILFLMFAVMPTVKSARGIRCLVVIASLAKLVQIVFGGGHKRITNLCCIETPLESDLVCTGNGDCFRRLAEAVFAKRRVDIRNCFLAHKPLVVSS